MNTAALKTSLALWKRRHAYRSRKVSIAHARNDRAAVTKWHKLLVKAGQMIRQRERQIAAQTSKPSARERAIKLGRSHIGVHEVPNGSNGGGIIDVWERSCGVLHVAWCGIHNIIVLRAVGVPNVPNAIMSVGATEDMARAKQACFRGWTTNTHAALPGDLVCLGVYGQHEGMVEEVLPDGSLWTIEGNHMNAVQRVHRPPNQVRGICQIHYPS